MFRMGGGVLLERIMSYASDLRPRPLCLSFPLSKWPKEVLCWQGRGMFSLGDAAPANFVTNIAGEVAVVVSGHKYHK